MNLTHEDFQKAQRISNAIQDYFRINYDKMEVRSTDIYEFLAKYNLIERDRHVGLHFREFLNKLKQGGFISLIPQCRWISSPSGTNEWHFVRMSNEKLKEIRNKHTGKRAEAMLVPTIKKEYSDPSLDREKANIARLPRKLNGKLTPQCLEARKSYPRAYEFWSKKEIAIMKRVFSVTDNINKVAEVLQRQPHTVKDKLKELKML